MGLRINADLETSAGPSQEVYLRVESFRWSKVTNTLDFAISCWLNQESAAKFSRTYADDKLSHAKGLLTPKVVYYSDDDAEGVEVEIKNFYNVSPTTSVIIEEPIFEEKEISKEIPYVSFDENGDEITLYRTKIEVEKVQVGVNKVEKEALDFNVSSDTIGYCYNVLLKELEKVFSKDNIEILK